MAAAGATCCRTRATSRQRSEGEHAMNRFEWREEFAVGVSSMDDTHREFVECVDALLQADEAGLSEALRAFTEHARSHFGQEDRDMQASAYESAGCHVEEHAAVLRSAEE